MWLGNCFGAEEMFRLRKRNTFAIKSFQKMNKQLQNSSVEWICTETFRMHRKEHRSCCSIGLHQEFPPNCNDFHVVVSHLTQCMLRWEYFSSHPTLHFVDTFPCIQNGSTRIIIVLICVYSVFMWVWFRPSYCVIPHSRSAIIMLHFRFLSVRNMHRLSVGIFLAWALANCVLCLLRFSSSHLSTEQQQQQQQKMKMKQNR